MRLPLPLLTVSINQNTLRTNLPFDKRGEVVRTEKLHQLTFPTLLLNIFLILFVVAFTSLFFIPHKAFAYASADPDGGISFSPRAFGIPQYGTASYTVTYTNNSNSDIKDITFGPGGTTGLGSSFVQLQSVIGCDSVSISSQGDFGTCYISIPVGSSKTITANFSNGGWTVTPNNENFNYIPIGADEMNGTSVSVTPNVAVFTGVSFSPPLLYIPRYGTVDYTATYTNNSSSDIKDIAFGPGGTTGAGPSFVQIQSFSGCDSVSISPQNDLGTCYISIPVGSSKTITASFSDGGWTNGNGSGNDGWNYIPATADMTDGTGIGVSPYMYMSNPIIHAFAGATINQGETYTATGSFTDPNTSDTSWTATVGYGDGSGLQPLTLNGTTFALNHIYTTAGTYTVSVSVTDDQGTTGVGTAIVIVNAANSPPTVGAISVSNPVVQVNKTVTVSANFTDPDTHDTHTASWNWGDGKTSLGTVIESNGSGSVTNSHTYTTLGAYTIVLTVTDNGGLSGTSQTVVAVIPSNGLAGANLSGLNYSGANLSNQNISGSNLQNATFTNTNLQNANLSGVNAPNASFQNANMTGANLAGSTLQGANFTNVNLTSANLKGANFKNAIVTGVTWSNTICPDGTNSNNDHNTCQGHGGGL